MFRQDHFKVMSSEIPRPAELTLKAARIGYKRSRTSGRGTEPCQNSPALLWLKRTAMLYTVQQWET